MIECDVKDCENKADIKHQNNVYCATCYIAIRGWVLAKKYLYRYDYNTNLKKYTKILKDNID